MSEKILFVPCFLVMTLFSHYSVTIGAPIYSLVAVLLIAFLVSNKIDLVMSNISFLFLVFISIIIICSIFIAIHDSVNIKLLNALLFLIFSILVFICFNTLYFSVDRLLLIFKYVLVIHVTCFFAQFISYYFLSIQLDFVSFLTGEESRNIGGLFRLLGKRLFRSSGLFTEPGNYGNFLAVTYAFYLILESIQQKKHNLLMACIFISSLFMTFSIYAIIFAFLFILYFSTKVKNNILIIIFTILLVLITINFVIPYVINRLTKGSTMLVAENSTAIMYSTFSNYMFNRNLINLIFGDGFFNDLRISGVSVNDMGLLVYMYFASGIVGLCGILAAFFAILFKYNFNRAVFLFLIIFSFSKLSLTYMLSISLLALLSSRQLSSYPSAVRKGLSQ